MTAGRLLFYTLDREREAGMQRILIVLWSGRHHTELCVLVELSKEGDWREYYRHRRLLVYSSIKTRFALPLPKTPLEIGLRLFQFGKFSARGLQNWHVGIGVFPQREEFLVRIFSRVH